MFDDTIYLNHDFLYNDILNYYDSFNEYNLLFNNSIIISCSNDLDLIDYCNLDFNFNPYFYYNTIFINFLYYLYYLFSLFCFLSISSLFIIIFISKFIYYPLKNDFNISYNENPYLYDYEPFLFEYIDEYNYLESYDISKNFLNILQYKFLITNTPYGIIIMNYDFNNNSFDYYSKNSNTIPFEYLDTVARSYVVNYNCKNIYIESKNLNDNKPDKDIEKNTSINDNIEKKSHIFYSKTSKTSKTKLNKFVSNKFKYKGTFSHFNNLITFHNYNTFFIFNSYDCNDYNEFIDPSNNSYNINYILDNFKDYHISNNHYILFTLSKNNHLSTNNLHNLSNINQILNNHITLYENNELFDVVEPYEIISSLNTDNKISYSQFKNKS